MNTAALTGESLPRDCEPGANVISGCVRPALLRVRTTKPMASTAGERSCIWWRIEHETGQESFARFARGCTRLQSAYAALALAGAAPGGR